MQPYKDPDEFIKALGADAYQERIDQAENSFMFESNDGVKVHVFFVNIDEIEASLELLKSEIDKITI